MFSNLPISIRFATSLALTLLAVALLLLLVVLGQLRAVGDRAEERQLGDLHLTLQADIMNTSRHAAMMAFTVLNAKGVTEAVANRDRERLQELTLPVFDVLRNEYDLRQIHFHTPQSHSFLRLHQLEHFDDDLSSFRATVVATNVARQPQLGLEGGVFGLGVRGVVPVFHQRNHVGSLEVGLSFGQAFFDAFTQQYSAPAAMYHLSRAEDHELETFATTIPGGTTLTQRQVASALNGQTIITRTRVDGRDWAVMAKPVPDFSGNNIAVAEILIDRTDYVQSHRNTVFRVVIIGALTLLVGLLVAWLVSRSISRPIEQLTLVTEKTSRGEFTDDIVGVERKDEIGDLARAIRRLSMGMQVAMGRMKKRS